MTDRCFPPGLSIPRERRDDVYVCACCTFVVVTLDDECTRQAKRQDLEEGGRPWRRPEREIEPPVSCLSLCRFQMEIDTERRYIAYETWSLSLPSDESLQSLMPFAKGPVASHGKVLGNRTTLYKYLNSRAFGVLTEPAALGSGSSEVPPTCGLYIVDGVKGSIVYHAVVPGVTGKTPVCDVRVSLTENWLVYHYYDEGVGGQTKGWRMVSVELYEGLADQKTGRCVCFCSGLCAKC